jgi:hypothetical protein
LEATLLAKEKELNGLKLKLMDKKAEMKVEWRKILAPEQVGTLDRIHHRWQRHHFHRHHWRGVGKTSDEGPAGKTGR